MMVRIINKLRKLLVFIFLRFKYKSLDKKQRRATKGSPQHFGELQVAQKVLLFAGYQNGKIRKDIKLLFSAAKAQGFQVLFANTGVLADKTIESVDKYIELPNYGRDFASYQAGFLDLFALESKGVSFDKLVLLNDSVFYFESRVSEFLERFVGTDKSVLGVTENYDIKSHYGSFAIFLARDALYHPKHKAFWKNYELSNFRPKVIAEGELAYSGCLKSVSSNLGSMYGGGFLLDYFASDEILDLFLNKLKLKSDNMGWNELSAIKLFDEFYQNELKTRVEYSQLFAPSEEELPEGMSIFTLQSGLSDLGGYKSIKSFICKNFGEDQADLFSVHCKKRVMQQATSGSQIHQNMLLLIHAGLPFIKLDCFYRGVLDWADVTALKEMDFSQGELEVVDLLLSRPFGGKHLPLIERQAFYNGYI